jgi:signal transduction histidine kinase
VLKVKILNDLKTYFIGDIPSGPRSEQKRIILTFNLSIICIAVSLIYAVFDIASNIYYSIPAYVILFTIPAAALFMIRASHYKTAKVMLMVSTNLVVFWTAINDPFETGAFLFFIPTGIGSFAILGFTESKTGIFLTLLTAILFLLAYTADLRPVELPELSRVYIMTSFIFNYFISLTISVLIVYFQMDLNRSSENELIQKEIFASQKNSELQKVNEELDRFVYSVSHDLRSPLSSILGLINIAKLTEDHNELAEILSMIQDRVNAQDHFIREIIDYSRNARTETVIEKIELKLLVEEIILSLKFHGDAERIAFRNLVPETLAIFSDRIRLRVILSNLIGNAIKYHDYHKDKPFIEIDIEPDQETIFIRDNGSGMKAEHQDKIFQMFYRGSDKSTGSGLGLFITREAVSKLGGSIRVISTYGQGSDFRVTIPLGIGGNP